LSQVLKKQKKYEAACQIEIPRLKKAAKQIVAEQYVAKANHKDAEMPVQGELLTLLGQDEADITWK
jgi:hypothetical protein